MMLLNKKTKPTVWCYPWASVLPLVTELDDNSMVLVDWTIVAA